MQKYFTSIQLCYNAVCTRELVPWTHEFEELDKDASTAILHQDSGSFKQGLYVRKNGYWTLALNYEDLCTAISESAQLKLVAETSISQSFPDSPTLYRNGYKVAGATITPGVNLVWVVSYPPSGGSGSGPAPGSTITLTDMFGVPIGDFLVA